MIHLASILVADGDAEFASDLLSRLRRSGYDGRMVPTGNEALQDARTDVPDMILIGPSLTGMDPLALAAALKADDKLRTVPVCLLARKPDGEDYERAAASGVDDVFELPVDDSELTARIRPLVRLATMQSEVRMRQAAARALGVSVAGEPSDADESASLLLVGRNPGRVQGLLEQVGAVKVIANLYEAEHALSTAPVDAAVILVENNAEAVLDFCAHARHNPRLYNLPVVLVAPAGPGLDPVDAYRRGASQVLRQPLDERRLTATLAMLVRRQKQRWSMRDALMASLQHPTRDGLTGGYSRDFLEAYLKARLDQARQHDRHLSVVFFYVPNVEGVREQFGDEAASNLLEQLSHWISGLLRTEDLSARFEGNEFCAVLSDTPRDEAEVVMQRIAGVLSHTDFAIPDVYQPVRVWVQVGLADLKPEDDAASLIARARQNME